MLQKGNWENGRDFNWGESRMENREKGTEEREITLRLSKRPQVIMLTKFCCLHFK